MANVKGATADSVTVPEMCTGCGWNMIDWCDVILDPTYFWEKHGGCFAKASRERVREIEREIRINKGDIKGVGR